MKQTIRLSDIYSADLFTRSKATELNAMLRQETGEVELDFDGISFMSRSFADELYNVVENFKQCKFTYSNRNEEVTAMMEKVSEGRQRERKRGISHAKIYEFHDMESLSNFLVSVP